MSFKQWIHDLINSNKTIKDVKTAQNDDNSLILKNELSEKIIPTPNKNQFNFPSHTLVEYQMDDDMEHLLQMIKIDFDSRYAPEEYRIDIENLPTQTDKENGRIVLLWWLNKFNLTNKMPPSYFYYRYGVYVDEEIRYLNKVGWLNRLHLTKEGLNQLTLHNDVIDNHRYLSKDIKDSIENHKKKIEDLADAFEIEPINLSEIKLNDWSTSDGQFTKEQGELGYKYFEIAKELTKRKEYKKSLAAVVKAWSLGYQAHDTWLRGAIDARYLKDRRLEETILLMGVKWADVSHIQKDQFEKRLKRVHELMANEMND